MAELVNNTTLSTSLFKGEGEMRSLLQHHNWRSSALGMPDKWPAELVTVVDLMLQARYPAVVAWGPDALVLYNDAYCYLLGERHPKALCQPFRCVWPEFWVEIKPVVEAALQGVPAYFQNHSATISPNGFREKRWFNSSYSPVRDRSGKVLGLFNAGFETTKQVLHEQRLAFEIDVTNQLRDLSSPEDVVLKTNELLGKVLNAFGVAYAITNDVFGAYAIESEWTMTGMPLIDGLTFKFDNLGAATASELRSGKIVSISDLRIDELNTVFAPSCQGPDLKSLLLIPVLKDDRLWAIQIIFQLEAYYWCDQDVILAKDTIKHTWGYVERVYLDRKRKDAEGKLRKSEAHLSAIFGQTAAGIAEIDTHGYLTMVNDRYCQMLGRNRSDLIGTLVEELFFPADREKNVQLLETLLMTGEPFNVENRYRLHNGFPLWVSKTISVIRPTSNEPIQRIIAIVVDITERKRIEDELNEQTQRLQLATEAAEIGLFEHDLKSAEIEWNPRTRRHFGIPAEVKISRQLLYDLIYREDRARVRQLHADMLQKGHGRYATEYRILTSQGEFRWLAVKGKVVSSKNMESVRFVGTVMDITDRKQAEAKIREASQHDSLTGLPNRALLYEYCEHILAMSSRFGDPGALLFIDLDRFKPINDLYGHDVGDKVLQEVSRRLKAVSRKENFVSRLGGDEFIVVLPRISSADDAAIVAKKMLISVGQAIKIDSVQVSVSPSIGICLFPDHANELELVIRCADMAMYAAKRNGRNSYAFYSPRLTDQADEQRRIEILLQHALETDQLILFYQPILNLATRDLVGVEALVRLPSENGTLLNPSVFIPVAEATGLINRIGDWVIKEACRQQRAWCDKGMTDLSVAINVSPIQFRQINFVTTLASVIADTNIDPRYLHIEVTESAAIYDLAATIKVLDELQSMGISIALDDFGTGYSSLSVLSSMPLNKIKIDQSFIRQMIGDQKKQSIIEAIIGLGKTLKLQVVGEGVELEDALPILKNYGCDQVQGFLFSAPLSAGELEDWVRDRYFTNLS